jgi:hypothetical protein
MVMAAPEVNPEMTLWLRKYTTNPSLSPRLPRTTTISKKRCPLVSYPIVIA